MYNRRMESTTTRDATVRVQAETHAVLRDLAGRLHTSMAQVLADAVEQYRRKVFWDEYDRAIERLMADPEAWEAYLAEGRALEGTIADGLEPEDWEGWFAPDEPDESERRDANVSAAG
jgi:hypothetical protein